MSGWCAVSITSRRYGGLWARGGRVLPWVRTQQISMHGAPVQVAEQLPAWPSVPLLAVLDEAGHQGGRPAASGRSPLSRAAGSGTGRGRGLGPQHERSAAAEGGLGVQSQQQCVEFGIVAAVRGGLAALGEAVVGDGPASGGHAAGFVYLPGGFSRR